jgi:protein-tyrosine-phosphatase
MPNILFVCSANRFRSVLAAERFRTLLKKGEVESDCVVSSAGIWAVEGAAPIKEAVHFASSMQVNIESVRSREINHRIVSDADLILVMTQDQREAISLEFPQARNKTFLLSDVAIGQSFDIPDPVTSPDEDPVEVGQEIFSLIDTGFEKILSRAANR